jgi:hypothetical protein
MTELNHLDLIDILFWIRRLIVTGLYNRNLNFVNQPKLHTLILKNIEANNYTLRFLINIYYDYAFINKDTERVS